MYLGGYPHMFSRIFSSCESKADSRFRSGLYFTIFLRVAVSTSTLAGIDASNSASRLLSLPIFLMRPKARFVSRFVISTYFGKHGNGVFPFGVGRTQRWTARAYALPLPPV